MTRQVPKNAAALIITEDPEDGFIDIQILHPEGAVAGDKRVAIVSLAEHLLESSLFGYNWEDEDIEEPDPFL